MRVIAVVALLGGCGRVSFENVRDAATDGTVIEDAPAIEDASTIDPSLLLWFEMDTPAAVEIADSSMYGRHATCTACPTPIAGVRGGAHVFNGVDQNAYVTHAPELELQTATVALWLRLEAVPSALGSAFGKPYGAADLNTWQLIVDSSLQLGIGGRSVASSYVYTPLVVSEWTHITAVWAADMVTVYRNGVVVSTVPLQVAYDTQDIVIGSDVNSGVPVQYWSGAMDDVRLYSRALSEAEIIALAAP